MFGTLRSGAIAARLPGLQGGLQHLPRAEHSVPRARAIRAVRASARIRSRRSRRAIRSPTPSRTTRARSSSGPGRRPTSSPVQRPIPTIRPRPRPSARRRPTWTCSRSRANTSAAFRGSSSTRCPASVSGDGRRLHLRDPQRLYQARRSAVEPLFPRPQDRDAAADHRRRGRIQGRHAADADELRQGRLGVPDLGGGAQPRSSARRSASG